MFFWWICGGESGLPILFLCHLKTAPPPPCFFHSGFKKWNEHFSWHYDGAKQAFLTINWCHLLVINPAEIQDKSHISKKVSRECEDIWTEEKAAEGTKDPKKFLVLFSFNKPVVEQPKDLGCDHTRMFLMDCCGETWWTAGILWLMVLSGQLQNHLHGEPMAGVCSGGISCQMGALWWRLL